MEVYFDNSATTRCYDAVREIVDHTMMGDYGNPSAMHNKGVEAEKYIKESRAVLARLMKVHDNEIYFTSGGTESNNWALLGTALGNRRQGNHIITTDIEHSAVLAPLTFLEEQGFEITKLGVDSSGRISLKELEDAITDETILVSAMYVNNEIGSVQDIEAIGELIKGKNPKTYFHVDATQAFGKYRIYPKRLKVDMLSASSHKFHGPKGAGFLYIKDHVKIHPLIMGGGQQNGMRSGTENVSGVAGMGKAAELIYKDLDKNCGHLYELKKHLILGLKKFPNVVIHGMNMEEGAPHIVNASFVGVRSEVMLHALEEHQIYVSAGSACSSHRRSGSATLLAIGCPKEERESAVRFSFSEFNTIEEVNYVLRVLAELLPMLRRYTRH
ncbi:cysteine desulfurase [Blautia liquoris]|uniref:Cysteine desulfurase n=1 Tax=Blautia liquoris TaxID=2779518 RepID=A0A7M2RHL1_9FIRM|nr:cysteine desulfurase family protein [Blautia liquoris]QOV19815.1 cysteine desulfurase [Blautia liquoris]